MPSYTIEKCDQGSFSQLHSNFGEAAIIQWAWNGLASKSFARVGQEFTRFHAGIQLTKTMFHI